MILLIAYLRFMQFYAHVCHNTCYGDEFFQDHEYFKELYTAYETHYDDIVERSIGLGIVLEMGQIHMSAAQMFMQANYKQDTDYMFKALLAYEQELCKRITALLIGSSEGTKQMLGEICNQSEMRQYKLKQRTKGEAYNVQDT